MPNHGKETKRPVRQLKALTKMSRAWGREFNHVLKEALKYTPVTNWASEPVTKDEKAEFGRNSWMMLENISKYFPRKASERLQQDAEEFMFKFMTEYPCEECRVHSAKDIKKIPPQCAGRTELKQWIQAFKDETALRMAKEKAQKERTGSKAQETRGRGRERESSNPFTEWRPSATRPGIGARRQRLDKLEKTYSQLWNSIAEEIRPGVARRYSLDLGSLRDLKLKDYDTPKKTYDTPKKTTTRRRRYSNADYSNFRNGYGFSTPVKSRRRDYSLDRTSRDNRYNKAADRLSSFKRDYNSSRPARRAYSPPARKSYTPKRTSYNYDSSHKYRSSSRPVRRSGGCPFCQAAARARGY